MNNTIKPLVALAISMLLSLGSYRASAISVPLPPGATVVGGPTFVTAGAALVASLTGVAWGPTPGVASINGKIDSWVYSGDLNNPYGGLTFVYQVHNSPTSVGVIEHLTVNDYSSFLINVGFDPASGGIAPSSENRGFIGTPVSFNFGAPGSIIPPGASSFLLILETSATSYEKQLAGVIDGTTANTTILGPSVPDGGLTIAFLGFALVGVEGLRRKFAK